MNKLQNFGFLILGCVACTIPLQPANAAQIDIVSESSRYENVGDFSVISGTNTASSPGQTETLWSSKNASGGYTQNTTMGTLHTFLSENGITSTNVLVFEFGLNESGNPSSVTIEALNITFNNIPGGGTQVFSLDSNEDNFVIVQSYGGGADRGEAKFQVDLDFDFMQHYNPNSTENLVVSSTMSNQDAAGNEVFYLNAVLTQEAISAQEVPFEFSPSLGIVISLGIFSLPILKNKLRASE